MSQVRSAWCALALAFVFLIPTAPNAGPPEDIATLPPAAETESYARVYVTAADAATLGGVEVIEPYKNFVLARIQASAAQNLRARGISVEPEEPFAIRVNGYTFDTREDIRVPSLLAAPPVLDGASYHLVQFRGPVKEEWRWGVEALGGEALAYVPHNAYLVRASSASMASIRSLRVVQWTDAFHPAYKDRKSVV